jgi:hypothetical protein
MKGSDYLRLVAIVALVAGTIAPARGDVTPTGATLDSDGTVAKISQISIWAESLMTNTQFGNSSMPDGQGRYTLSLPDPPSTFIVRGSAVIGKTKKYARSADLPQKFDDTKDLDLTFHTEEAYIKKFGKPEFKKHLESLLKILPKDHRERKSLERRLDELTKEEK